MIKLILTVLSGMFLVSCANKEHYVMYVECTEKRPGDIHSFWYKGGEIIIVKGSCRLVTPTNKRKFNE